MEEEEENEPLGVDGVRPGGCFYMRICRGNEKQRFYKGKCSRNQAPKNALDACLVGKCSDAQRCDADGDRRIGRGG